jgi:hypothetical protein
VNRESEILRNKKSTKIKKHRVGSSSPHVPGGTNRLPSPTRIMVIRQSIHACRLGIQRKMAQAQQIRSIILRIGSSSPRVASVIPLHRDTPMVADMRPP